MNERYPSRLPEGADEAWLDRDVPAVWSAPGAPGPLSPAALVQYAEDGVLALPGWFGPDEVAALQAELERVLAGARPGDPEVVLEPDSADAVRSVFAVHRRSERFAAIAADPRLLAIARQILDDDVYLHQARLNLKPGFEGQGFWWHSDFETWHHEDGMPTMRCFSCVLVLSEVTPHNGPVLFVPGSHRTFVGCVGETPGDNHTTSLRVQTVGTPSRTTIAAMVARHGLVAPTGPPGTVILFDCNVLHGSAANVTPLPRHHLFFVYNAVSNRLGPPPSGIEPRPEHIATRATFAPLR